MYVQKEYSRIKLYSIFKYFSKLRFYAVEFCEYFITKKVTTSFYFIAVHLLSLHNLFAKASLDRPIWISNIPLSHHLWLCVPKSKLLEIRQIYSKYISS
jgi:hypothetical protein